MTEIITDTRALLRMFRQSDYGDIHLRAGDFELFIARPAGGANPLRVVVNAVAAPPQTDAPSGAARAEQLISAPHIASFVSALAVGQAVGAGEAIARLELLGEPVDLIAQQPGLVAEVFAEAGALVEYGAPILKMLSA